MKELRVFDKVVCERDTCERVVCVTKLCERLRVCERDVCGRVVRGRAVCEKEVCERDVCERVVCERKKPRGGGGWKEAGRDTEPKTRNPDKDVGKNMGRRGKAIKGRK